MSLALLLASSNVSRLNGAVSPGRWQVTQLAKRIGATSRLKVTEPVGAAVGCWARTAAADASSIAAARTPNETTAGRRRECEDLELTRDEWLETEYDEVVRSVSPQRTELWCCSYNCRR